MRVPPSRKSELEKLDEKLEQEADEWNKLGLNGNMTVHSPESLWVLKLQIQALINTLLEMEIFNQDELNINFKTLMLTDMVSIRKSALQQRRESLLPDSSKSGIVIPGLSMKDKDGNPSF